MSDFGDWLQGFAGAGDVDIEQSSCTHEHPWCRDCAFDVEVVALAAQQHKALEVPATCTCTFYDLGELEPPPHCPRCLAIKAAKSFKEKYE